jgi:A118 family predicted phage portal protein
MPKLNKRLFRAVDLGKDAEYNVFDPPIRDASLLNGLNAIFCRIEDLCGLARGTISDPNVQAMTATQIITNKQRTYETINANQKALEQCLRDVIHAMDVYASALNLAPAGDYEVSFEWDDSVIVDTNQQLNERLLLVNAGAMSKAELRQWYLGETEAQAKVAVQQIQSEQMQSMMAADTLPM